jgi:hypothetical protein
MAGIELPWMKMYPAETLSDSNFQGWDISERGAWFTLVLVAWREGSIPSDQSAIARLLHVDGGAMRGIWSAIGSRFVEHPDYPGRLTSPRLEEEREEAIALHAQKSKSGKAGAISRWGAIRKRGNGTAMALPSQDDATALANDGDQDRAVQGRCSAHVGPVQPFTHPASVGVKGEA